MSLTESMRKDPDKFNAFIFCDNKSSSSTTQTRGYSQYYDTSYGQHQQQYPSQAYTDMLLEEAEKLYVKLAKDLVDETITVTLSAHPHHYYHCYHLLKNDKVIQQQQLIKPTWIQ